MYEIARRCGPVAFELLRAWSQLPKRACIPDRSSFDPMAIARILPVVSLIERKAYDEWRFRLVGTEIERRWGRRLTGCEFGGIVSPQVRRVMCYEFRQVVECPCGSLSRRHIEFGSGRVAVVETLRLPLRDNEGAVSLILGCSGELPERAALVLDLPRAIVTITEQAFLDIGAGCPSESALAAACDVA